MNLQPGDILLWRVGPGSSWIDRLVGWGERHTDNTGGSAVDYYHVGIVGPDALHYYDSAPGGVKNSPIPSPWPDNVEVRRFITPLSADQLAKMWQYANSQIGTGYDYLGVLTAGWIEVAGKPYCSEFVWRICTYASKVLCAWKKCLSPDDIASSNLIQEPK